jgi:hypothetical protein
LRAWQAPQERRVPPRRSELEGSAAQGAQGTRKKEVQAGLEE